jgi:NADH-quinone oxidoreductase subunit G
MPDPVEPAPQSDSGAVTVTIDGRQVKARKGEMLIAVADRAGTYIPRFCYHSRMKPVGMCRMCLVDLKGPRGFTLSPACFIPVAEGMEAVTNSPAVKKAQEGVLELLLANHPLDCPVCDKGGECPLQDQTMAHGPGETRFVEEKRHWDKPIPLSSLILIDRERCIQCARCTRFAEEVAGDAAIDFASRSDTTEVAIYPGRPFVSNFSGNVVQICPVGALLAKPYRFKARPWDLEQVETTCTLCAVGCRVSAQSSSDQVVRFLGVDSDPVNWGWLCDKGRFAFEALSSAERLTQPLVRRAVPGAGRPSAEPSGGRVIDGVAGGERLVEASWAEAFATITDHLEGVPGDAIGVIGGARLANEDAYAWAKLARTVLHTDNVDAQLGDGLPAELIAGLPRATIDEVCEAPLVITIAPDLKEELPVLYLRLRHAAVEKGVPLVEISPTATGLSSKAAYRLHYRPGELADLVRALCSGAEVTAGVAGIAAGDVERARSAIANAVQAPAQDHEGHARSGGGPRVAVVIGRPSLAEAAAGAAEAALVLAGLPGVAFLPALRRSNVHGAIDLGLSPGLLPGRVATEDGRAWFEHHWGTPLPRAKGLDTLGMLSEAAAGRMDVVFLVGADPLSDCPDTELAARALEAARFVVAIDAFAGPSTAYADVVLPAAVYTERRGTFTNLEGRVTWLGQKVTAPGTARPDWMIAVELASRLGGNLGASSLDELWAEVLNVSPLHGGVSHELLASRYGRNGAVVPLGATGASELVSVPRPLDPMAGPGIDSAELHPAPYLPGAVQLQVVAARDGAGTAGDAGGGPTAPPVLKAVLKAPNPKSAPGSASRPARSSGKGQAHSLRLVAKRPMWDAGALVQRSPSLACLHPPLVLALHPSDLAQLGTGPDGEVRVSSARGSLVVVAVADPAVTPGTAVMPFNLPAGGAGSLIDASATCNELTIEHVGAP